MEGKVLTRSLALTCRLLLDRRMLELKRESYRLKKFQHLSKKLTDENERLNLALFLEKHSSARLQILIGEVNMSASENDQCNCLWCYDRLDSVCVLDLCKFKPLIEEFLDEVDEHFVQANAATWFTFPYGSCIWKATRADDPKLKKLARLFKMLWQHIIENEG